MNTEISDGRRHKIIVTLNIVKNAISVDLDRREERQTITGALEVPQSVDLALFLGYAGDVSPQTSVSGCITNLQVLHSQKQLNVEVSAMSSGASNEGCPDPCQTLPCNAGVCQNLFNGEAICDCVGSGKEGTNCDTEQTVVSLGTDQYLEYILPDSLEARQIQNLSISFKTKTDQEKSVLLFMPITSTEDFILEQILVSIDSSGSPRVNSIDFTEERSFTEASVNDGNWHHLLLNFNYGAATVTVTLDDKIRRSVSSSNPKISKNLS